MPVPNIPEGLLGLNLDDLFRDVTGALPGPIGDAIRRTTAVLLGPDGPNIGDPQPQGERPIPTTDPGELGAAVKAIDVVLGDIGQVLRFSFLIPPQLAEPLRLLSSALSTIRSWLV